MLLAVFDIVQSHGQGHFTPVVLIDVGEEARRNCTGRYYSNPLYVHLRDRHAVTVY